MWAVPAILAAVLPLVGAASATGIAGRLVDARSGAVIADAEITIVGKRGVVRSDGSGHFRWPIVPQVPAVVVVVLADGRVARPIRLTAVDDARELMLLVDVAHSESITVEGSSPTIDASPASSTTLLTARNLELRHPPTLTQALDVIPGVSAIAEGQAAVPAIRGLARGRTLILIDGARAITERRAGANASFLDPGVTQTIEVARGPGSVAYGSDAFGGVIAARTRRPNYMRPFTLRFAGTAGWGVPEQRGDLEISKGHGSGGFIVGIRARTFDDYAAPAGRVPNSHWRDHGLRARVEQQAGGGLWSIGWHSDLGRSLGRPRSDSDVILATSPYDDSHRLTASFERDAVGSFRNLRFDALAGTIRQRTDQDRLPTATRPRSIERADVSSRGMQLRLTAERLIGGAQLHVGADAQGQYGLEAADTLLVFNRADVMTSATTSESIASAHRTSVGFFAEVDRRVAARVRLSGGMRVDAVRNTNAGGYFGDRSVSNEALAGLVAVTVTPAERLTLTAQVARGFRDPTLSDRFYRGVVGRGFIEGNPDIKPETSLQFDLTARFAVGAIQLNAAAYRYRISDLVERYAATPTTFLFRNRGAAALRGLELEAHAPLPAGFGLTVTAEASRGRDAVDGTPLDDVAPSAASVMVRHTLGARVSSYARLKGVASHGAAGPSEVPTPRYTMADGGFVWRLCPRLELHGTLRNVLDDAYPSSAGPRWVWAPGRHGSLTLVVNY